MIPAQTITFPKASDLKEGSPLQSTPGRLASIDILRAITMVLMIFVNDLWSLQHIPAWLEHVSYQADGMGLADTIFPAFLFIVGMSVPFSIANRRKKGDTTLQLVMHIGSRTLALLVMGVFLVNGENINEGATGMIGGLWYTLSCISFILIWNIYPATMNSWLSRSLQMLGIGILLTLAFIYRGGETDNLNRFSTYWWGILGLIGWSYLAASLITVIAGGKYYIILTAWLLFCVLSMVSSAGLMPGNNILSAIPGPIIGGTLTAFTLGGVLITRVFQHFRKRNLSRQMMIVLLLISISLIIMGLYTRTFWGISKLRATPAWLFLCSSFTILGFMAIYWLADFRGKANWFKFIKPAGTDTLLCYLIPYFAYALVRFLGISWPEFMLTGAVGLTKSFVFALLCVWMAGLLSKNGIRLKL
jgi:predicted acyltransferase